MGVNSAFTLRRDSNRQFDQTYRPGVERTSFRTGYTELLIGGPYFRILLGDLRSTRRQFWVHGRLLMFAVWVVRTESGSLCPDFLLWHRTELPGWRRHARLQVLYECLHFGRKVTRARVDRVNRH